MLLLAIFVLAAGVFQAYGIPSLNAQIEFNDYEESTDDVVTVRNTLLATAGDGNTRGESVKLGSRYPTRTVFLNPPTATGTLSTSEERTVQLSNVESAGSQRNVGRYLTNEGNELSYETRAVTFDPAYNEFGGAAPVVVDPSGAVYRDYENPVIRSQQTLVDGNRITLPSVGGNLETTGTAADLTATAKSPQMRSVSVTGRNDENITLALDSDLSESTWRDLLADEIDETGTNPDRHVLDVTKPDPNRVLLTLDGSQQYTLRASHTVLSETADATEQPQPQAAYLVSETDRETRTDRNGRVKLVVEARDEYHNPVSNAPVRFDAPEDMSFETEDGTVISSTENSETVGTVRTDDNGRATVWLNATDQLGTFDVNAELQVDGTATDQHQIAYRVFNSVSSDGGGGGEGEQAGRSLVVLDGVDTASADDQHITIRVNNIGSFETKVTGYRLDYAYAITSQGRIREGPTKIDRLRYRTPTGSTQVTVAGEAFERSSPYFIPEAEQFDLTPGDDTTDTIRIEFDRTLTEGDTGGNPRSVFISVGLYLEGNRTTTFTFQLSIPN